MPVRARYPEDVSLPVSRRVRWLRWRVAALVGRGPGIGGAPLAVGLAGISPPTPNAPDGLVGRTPRANIDLTGWEIALERGFEFDPGHRSVGLGRVVAGRGRRDCSGKGEECSQSQRAIPPRRRSAPVGSAMPMGTSRGDGEKLHADETRRGVRETNGRQIQSASGRLGPRCPGRERC
jgi:hypothetical protein